MNFETLREGPGPGEVRVALVTSEWWRMMTDEAESVQDAVDAKFPARSRHKKTVRSTRRLPRGACLDALYFRCDKTTGATGRRWRWSSRRSTDGR